MTIAVHVQVQLSPEDLLAAVSQLSPTELDEFTRRVLALRSQRRSPALSQEDLNCCQKSIKGFQKQPGSAIIN